MSVLRCDTCGKEPWWSLPRAGDPCPDDEGHLVKRSDTAQAILDALSQGHREGGIWIGLYSGYGKSLSAMTERLWAARFPDRRNRPTARNVERALAQLERDGLVERKERTGGSYTDPLYRLTEPS